MSGTQALAAPPGGEELVALAGRAARGLSLAAAPTFALLAAVTALDGSPMDRLCGSAPSMPLGGMLPMYLLMSAFHLPAWLKLLSSRWGRDSA